MFFFFFFLYFIFTAANQSVYHLLQLDAESGTAGQENYPAGLLLFLHPRQDDAGVFNKSIGAWEGDHVLCFVN